MTEAENRFAQLIFKYEAFIDELAGQEETKYRSLISYDAGKVNHVISSQQAALMRLEQLDQKREAAAAEAGLSGRADRRQRGGAPEKVPQKNPGTDQHDPVYQRKIHRVRQSEPESIGQRAAAGGPRGLHSAGSQGGGTGVQLAVRKENLKLGGLWLD